MCENETEIGAPQAAELLEVHVNTIYRWIEARQAGEFSPIQTVRQTITGRYRLNRAELEDMLRRGGVLEVGE